MPVDQSPQNQPTPAATTPATGTAPAATTTSPAAPAPPADAKAPAEETAEGRALKAEALKSAREVRELKAKLAELERRAADSQRQQAERETQLRELDELKARDPRAWLTRAAGEDPAAFARRIAGDTKDSQLERTIEDLRREMASLREKHEGYVRQMDERGSEAMVSNAYREILRVAESQDETALGAEEMRHDPAGAKRWIQNWAAKEWPQLARERGLDVNDSAAAALEAAKAIDALALAKVERLRQNERTARRLGLSAPQSIKPAESQGTAPPRTIAGNVAGTRAAAPATLDVASPGFAARERERRAAAVRVGQERMARDAASKRT